MLWTGHADADTTLVTVERRHIDDLTCSMVIGHNVFRCCVRRPHWTNIECVGVVSIDDEP